MDTSKQPPKSPQDESEDDLIAQVARLVARDVQAGNAAAPDRQRPGETASRASEPASPRVPSEAPDRSSSAGRETPARGETAQERSSERGGQKTDIDDDFPSFDFGFGTAGTVTSSASGPQTTSRAPEPEPTRDAIADLIAGAESEQAPDADKSDDGDLFDAPPVGRAGRGAPNWELDASVDGTPSARSHAGQDDRDPLSEIEALIGEAARVSGSVPGGRRVRSSFLPGDEEESEQAARAVDLAEASIHTATQARQREEPVRQEPQAPEPEAFERQQPERVPEPEMPDVSAATFSAVSDFGMERDADRPDFVAQDREDEPERRRSAGFLVPVLAGAVIVALIVGGYFMFPLLQTDTGEPPVLTADSSPLKQEPSETEPDSAATDSVVFSELSGTTSAEGETLVSRDETGGVTGDAVSSVVGSEDGAGELVNRSVRTVTVLPDGTIVSSDDGVAGGSVLPVDRPDVPEIGNSDADVADDPIGDAITAAIGEDAVDPDAVGAAPDAPTAVDTADQTGEPASESAQSDPAPDVPDAPQPIPRPENLVASTADSESGDGPLRTSAAGQDTVDTNAAPEAAAVPANADAGPGAWVQLASQRSEEVARAGVAELQARYGVLFGDAVPEVSRVDLAERGTFYRVRLPQPSIADANEVCDAIKRQGGDCFVLNN